MISALKKGFVLAFSLAAIGCFPQVEKRKNVICLIDYSGTIKPETLDIYAKTVVDRVIMNLGQFDKMVLIPIDEGSKMQAVQLISHDLSREKFTDPNDNMLQAQSLMDERLKKFKSDLREKDLSTVVQQKDARKQFTSFTDILGSLEQAALLRDKNEAPTYSKQFSDWNDGTIEFETENSIMILSDMIHESPDLNFARTTPDEKLMDKTIADLKAKGRIPDLTGTKIFVCGRTGKNNATIDAIHSFWKKYFEEAHAQLVIYDYDSGKYIGDYVAQKISS